MRGVEFFPALIYFLLLFFVPKSPRWLYLNKNFLEAKKVLIKINGNDRGERENTAIETSVHAEKNKE